MDRAGPGEGAGSTKSRPSSARGGARHRRLRPGSAHATLGPGPRPTPAALRATRARRSTRPGRVVRPRHHPSPAEWGAASLTPRRADAALYATRGRPARPRRSSSAPAPRRPGAPAPRHRPSPRPATELRSSTVVDLPCPRPPAPFRPRHTQRLAGLGTPRSLKPSRLPSPL